MRQLSLVVAAASLVALAACGSSSDDAPPYTGFVQPANTVVVNFSVNDSANAVWQAGELAWKGQMQYDPATRLMHFNSDWLALDPNWAPLYDDGPWDRANATTGAPGHEPIGATAGDHIWGVAGFIAKPAAGADVTVGYGLGDPDAVDRNATWYWLGSSAGSITITSASTIVNAPGQTFPAHGTYDMKLVIDSAGLAASNPAWTTTSVEVKGSKWGWVNQVAYDDGTHGDDTGADGLYTFVFSNSIDGTTPPYPGLLAASDAAEFVWVLGGVEYKVSGDASPTGVTAFLKNGAAGAWVPATVTMTAPGPFGANTQVIVP